MRELSGKPGFIMAARERTRGRSGPQGNVAFCRRFKQHNRSTELHEPNHTKQYEMLLFHISCQFVDRLRISLIVLLTSVWFGLGHYHVQGLTGVEQATIVGLVLGTIMAKTGRIFVLMVAHATPDRARDDLLES